MMNFLIQKQKDIYHYIHPKENYTSSIDRKNREDAGITGPGTIYKKMPKKIIAFSLENTVIPNDNSSNGCFI